MISLKYIYSTYGLFFLLIEKRLRSEFFKDLLVSLIEFWSFYVCQKMKSCEIVKWYERILGISNRIFRFADYEDNYQTKKKKKYDLIHISCHETHTSEFFESQYSFLIYIYLCIYSINTDNHNQYKNMFDISHLHESTIRYSWIKRCEMTIFI